MADTPDLNPLRRPHREVSNLDLCFADALPLFDGRDSNADGTDHQLQDDLYHAFRTAGYAQLRRIGISDHNGRVKLHGRVPTYFLKQFAQSLASSHPGVQVVDNHIEVAGPR